MNWNVVELHEKILLKLCEICILPYVRIKVFCHNVGSLFHKTVAKIENRTVFVGQDHIVCRAVSSPTHV